MENSYNNPSDPAPKTSTNKSENNPNTTADSLVQDGSGVIQEGHKEKAYDKSTSQEEFIDDKNSGGE